MCYFKKYTDLNMQKMCSPLNLKILKTYFCCGYHGIRLLPKIFSQGVKMFSAFTKLKKC